jgi:hypothetical protein
VRPIVFLKQLANAIPVGAFVGSGDAPTRPKKIVMVFKVSKGAAARPSV